MLKIKKWVIPLSFCFLLITAVFLLKESYAKASSIVLPTEYYFVFNGQKRETGTEYEMKSSELLLNVTSGSWEPETTVQWVSSEPDVVKIENTTYGSNFVKLVRTGPGYSTITAVVKQGTNAYTLSCQIKIDLAFDYQKTGIVTATTTQEKILVLNSVNEQKPIYLKYVDYTPDNTTTPVSGSAISASSVLWESNDESIVTVDEAGKVKAVGSGSTSIKVKTSTMSAQDKALEIVLKVVVKPTFTLTYDDISGNHHVNNSSSNPATAIPATGVPSNFVIQSNSSYAKNLKWEVYDFATKKLISQSDTSKLTYTVSTVSGNVSFSNVKAGTYEVYAFANEKYSSETNAPYAYMKIVVPINIGNQNIVMTVGDTYSILANSNIPGVGIFDYSYTLGNANIAQLNQTTGVVTAKSKGQIKLKLTYKTGQNLYDNAAVTVDDIYITITVIDGISLSTTNASLFTSGTILLNAIVTDPTQPIVWSSSDSKIATVVDGLITGIKPGVVTITASQTINGVTKKATCEITVQQSVTKITLDPSTVDLAIDAFKTIHATITPSNLSGVSLTWKSSNEGVVKIVESSKLTTTIQGVAGGTAVISAINQDNVVVGYCHVTVQQPVTSIVLSETSVSVDLSVKKLQLRATVYPENAMNQTVLWSSTDTSKAKVDANGMVTFLKPGNVSIIATSDDNGKIKAICNFTINIPVLSVVLDETTKTMYVGESARLSYIVLPSNASSTAVTWTSTNSSVVSVDNSGKVTAKSSGSAVIILKTVDGSYSVYCNITVRQVATGIKFDVNTLNLKAGEYYVITPTLTPKNSTDTELVWESSDTKIAVVDNFGKVIGKAAGQTIIMARTQAGAVAYCKVTVTQPVKGILLNFSEKTIYTTETFELKVSVNPTEATDLNVTWKSSNPKVATVTDKGVVKGLIGGATVITCTTKDGGYSAVCVVTVRELVSTVKLNYESYKLGVDKSVTLKATVTNPTATNQKVKWTSSNTKVAVVNSKGKVTGLKAGYAIITAVAQDGTEEEASCEIRVITPVTSVTVDKSYVSLLVGDSKKLKSTIKPSSATYRSAKWTSSDKSVASVDENGVITALKAGETTITVAAKDNSGKKAVCLVVVSNRVPSTGVTVMDKRIVMVSGETKTVQVALNPTNSTDDFTWSSDNTAVARVDKNTGKITARATGTANITVMTASGKVAVVEVAVVGLNFTSITLEQYTNYDYQLAVEGATSPVRWSVENSKIAIVSNGYISSRGLGTTTITATVNGRKLTCKVTVVKIK
ncbi:MAG: hypothetical protein K0S47_3320 [Herbinix sp.]|jgi:uncharacterized protein YjdB|nr:hypothetical protein [Herbinix sp.]